MLNIKSRKQPKFKGEEVIVEDHVIQPLLDTLRGVGFLPQHDETLIASLRLPLMWENEKEFKWTDHATGVRVIFERDWTNRLSGAVVTESSSREHTADRIAEVNTALDLIFR